MIGVVVAVVGGALAAAHPSSGAAPPGPPPPAIDAWSLVEKGAHIAAAVQPSPLFQRVQAQVRHADPILDEDIAGSLDAVRAYSPALDALDAAVATARCTLPRDIDAASVLRLADAALVTALEDAADKKPARAVADIGRAADLAALVARCKKPTLLSATLVVGIGEHTRPIAWYLAEQRQIDERGLARIAAGLQTSTTSAMFERALEGEKARLGHGFTLDEQKSIDEVGRRLDNALRDQGAMAAAAADFEHIPRSRHSVVVKCDATADPARYTITRAVAHALEHKGADALGNDSVVSPSFDGTGVMVLSAGPVARSCGFADGDLLVEVNGISTARVDQALVDAPSRVARDGYAAFRVVRRGTVVSWRVDVQKAEKLTTAGK